MMCTHSCPVNAYWREKVLYVGLPKPCRLLRRNDQGYEGCSCRADVGIQTPQESQSNRYTSTRGIYNLAYTTHNVLGAAPLLHVYFLCSADCHCVVIV